MVKEYLTPDFDVTVYKINDVITLDIGDDVEPDEGTYMSQGWQGDIA